MQVMGALHCSLHSSSSGQSTGKVRYSGLDFNLDMDIYSLKLCSRLLLQSLSTTLIGDHVSYGVERKRGAVGICVEVDLTGLE